MEDASLEPARRLFLPAVFTRIEAFLEAERAQLPLWFVAALGMGIAAWFALGASSAWSGVIAVGLGVALLGMGWRGTRTGRSLVGFGVALALGCATVWLRADWVASPVLNRPQMAEITGSIERVE
ncbi:MAG: hypothetical protein ABIU10_09290, partial [Sphingomicrobium sp.]